MCGFALAVESRQVYQRLVKILTIITAVTLITIFSSSCNTTIGLGRDLRLLGEGMESSAQKTRGGGDDPGAPVY